MHLGKFRTQLQARLTTTALPSLRREDVLLTIEVEHPAVPAADDAAPLVYEKHIDLSLVGSHQVHLKDGARAFELVVSGVAIKPLILCS